MIHKVNLDDELAIIDEPWSPHTVAELNGQHVKLARLSGEFIWHQHDDEDELFYVLAGTLEMHFEDRVLVLEPGELVVVPRGVRHKPVAPAPVQVMLFEPASTVNTGEVRNERTRESQRVIRTSSTNALNALKRNPVVPAVDE